MRKCLLLILMVLAVAATSSWAATPASDFLAHLDGDVQSGKLSSEDALLYKFYYGFDQEKLPTEYQPKVFSPLKSATPLFLEFAQTRDQISGRTVRAIEALISASERTGADKATYISPGGNFRMTYSTTGSDAVPSTDTNPANGIPDFVEKCASYMDYSWQVEIDGLGFTAPPKPAGYYEVGFESMSYYGYTSVGSGSSTTITLHNTFVGFPHNDDPEGNVWGAAKVTCCHEFKHASQRAQSGWSESGWVELDATWAEDIVYDYVNDYYNYLASPNPISAPATSLDDGGTGSYEDCVWQHFMTENWGDQIIPDFWTWRSSHTSQSMMTSYDDVLSNYGSSLREAWGLSTGWNYLTGSRALAGLGYGEASDYPTSGLVASLSSYPANRTGTVNHLAANMVRYLSLPNDPGTVSVVFDGQDGTQITLTAIITKTDGTGVIEVIALDGNNDADVMLSVPGTEIAGLGIAVGNGASLGSAISYDLTVDFVVDLPDPIATLSAASVAKSLPENTTGSELLTLSNTGEAGSVLDYFIAIYPVSPVLAPADKSVSGSSMSTPMSEYTAGNSYVANYTVYNGSTDDEWLTDITLDFPAGFNVTGSTNFVGGSSPMSTGGATGDGVVVAWHGVDGSGWGVIHGSESATATVSFTVDSGLSGNQSIAWNLVGDQYGSAPHDMSGSFILTAMGPSIIVTSPNGGEIEAIGQDMSINWTASLLSEVKIELSRNGGTDWDVLFASTPNDGGENWATTAPASSDCLLRISSIDDSVSDESDASFGIYQPVDWLTVTPYSGNLDQGDDQLLTLDFDATGLAVTDHTAYIVINHNGVASPSVVPVTLTVTSSISATNTPGTAFGLTGNYPNPFNPMTNIKFNLAQEGPAVVEVLDLRGHLLRTVFDGQLTAGAHQIRWDGRDGEGRSLASGLYLARLRSQEGTATRKMVLAR